MFWHSKLFCAFKLVLILKYCYSKTLCSTYDCEKIRYMITKIVHECLLKELLKKTICFTEEEKMHWI